MTNEYQHYLDLFQECLNKKYQHTYEGGSYLIEYDPNLKQLNIYFQWSFGYGDWLNNFSFAVKPYKQMKTVWKVHGGFFRVWESIEPYIKKAIDDIYEVKHIRIVGYSHGAALAMLCHEYCVYNYFGMTIESYAFGCPRVLKGSYDEELLARWNNFTVIRNHDDVVTHVPPRLFGFKHVGTIIDLTPKNYYLRQKVKIDEEILAEIKEEKFFKRPFKYITEYTKAFFHRFVAGHYDTAIIEQLERKIK